MERLNTINEDPRFQSYMSAEEDDRKILNSIKHEYYDKGTEHGLEQGIELGKEQIARMMLSKKYDKKEILNITGISIDDLDNTKRDF